MASSRCRRCCYFLLAALTVTGGLSSCRKRKPVAVAAAVTISPELKQNRIGQRPGPVYQSQAASTVHWQPWSQATFDHAKEANRLVFAVVALPELPGFLEVLQEIERDPAIVKALNEKYVPVLIDGDASREVGLLTARLCAEIKQPLELPLLMWLTSAANPVAWTPVSSKYADQVFRLFNQSDEMVTRMWGEDPGYVMKNSAMDQQSRVTRMLAKNQEEAPAGQPAEDALQALRQLNSLYDPYSRSIDTSGGLFPTGMMDALAAGALLPGMPEALRVRCLETTRNLLDDLLPSAMFDPLTGGVFSARASQSWALPNFTSSCRMQARVAASLFRACQLTGNPVALERALGIIAFAEKKFQQPDGLFADGSFVKSAEPDWLWSTEDIEKALPAEDAKWWIAATGMKALGNLPSEVDPDRRLFRKNSLSLVKPLAETAATLGANPAEFARRFEKSRLALLAVRDARVTEVFQDRSSGAGASFRMVSAYAAAFTATGDESYREKAAALLAKAKEKFSAGPRLTVYGGAAEAPVGAARAFIYALAIQACQDVADIRSDETPLQWAEELGATVRGEFKIDGALNEAAADSQLIKLPLVDSQKVFEDSTNGLLSLAGARRSAGDPSAGSSLKDLSPGLPKPAVQLPISYDDSILAALVLTRGTSIVVGKELSPELRSAIERLPLRLFPRRPAKDSDGVPAGSVRLISTAGGDRTLSSPSALRDALLLAK